MSISFIATKLVVRDVEASEHFYLALGLKVVIRNVGGEAEVRQQQSWLSETGDRSSHILILSRFLDLPPPPPTVYPGENWLAITVPDVDGALRTIEEAGGRIVRPGEDRPEHDVRAAIASDPEGHFIEIVGPMGAR
jgi:catechol 2,3-dioxygenase-like lactoylglutathione lyase family enzyme